MGSYRVLVTGAAGFIGSHVADHCLSLGFEVVAVDNLSGGVAENVPARATFVPGDLDDVDFVTRLWDLHGPFDYVYHLAAYAAEGLSHFVRRFNYRTNLLASINLINASVNRGVKHFVFTSSIAVYGPTQVPMREDTVPRPEDPYGIAKYAVELDLDASLHMFGLPYTVFRPHNVYGERQNIADKYRNVVGIFMNQLLQGKPMTVFGDGGQTRAFTHVDDVAPLIARAPLVEGARNQVFNVGSDRPYTVKELAMAISRAMDLPLNLHHLPARQEVVHAFSDHAKVHEVFDPPPAVTLDEGLRRMAAWVKSRGPAQPTEFKDIEIRLNLPAAWR
ncbi:MAG TPA: NAD-dependent epimerase/dehydratase family protein [Candidatus Limnocylindria bacterium]|nr:NAD-dependent epimerase/dehydratase family protein [Candidatus Limnocylindria bacterium]